MFFSTTIISSAVLASATFLASVSAQTTVIAGLAPSLLANAAVCPAPVAGVINTNELAVVTFVETATVTANVALIGPVSQPIGADVEVCLCVPSTTAITSLTLPVDLRAAALADIEAQATLSAGLGGVAATTFNNLLALPGSTVAVSLAPVSRAACVCPANATPTCVNAVCSCDCAVGFFFNAATNVCVLNASGAPVRTRRSYGSIQERQVTRSQFAQRKH